MQDNVSSQNTPEVSSATAAPEWTGNLVEIFYPEPIHSELWQDFPYPNPIATIWNFYHSINMYIPAKCDDDCELRHRIRISRILKRRFYIEWHDHHNQQLVYYPYGYSESR